MILVDANLLLYAYDPAAREHEASRHWLEESLSGTVLVRFSWPTVWAFLRIPNPRVFERPLTMAEAEDHVSSWLAQPVAGILEPGERHWEILRPLARDGQVSGPLVMDAALAAIAIEHGATLCTTDRDSARFPGLTWINPIASVEARSGRLFFRPDPALRILIRQQPAASSQQRAARSQPPEASSQKLAAQTD
jgi:toxin-antitoxin system PIN domain toxin